MSIQACQDGFNTVLRTTLRLGSSGSQCLSMLIDAISNIVEDHRSSNIPMTWLRVLYAKCLLIPCYAVLANKSCVGERGRVVEARGLLSEYGAICRCQHVNCTNTGHAKTTRLYKDNLVRLTNLFF
jgi:hypothetical protein